MNWMELVSQFLVAIVFLTIVPHLGYNALGRANLAVWRLDLLVGVSYAVFSAASFAAGGMVAFGLSAIFAFSWLVMGFGEAWETWRHPEHAL